MRDLHRQIRQEVQKRGMTDNVKLGAGGIREVEFIAQIFQMIRGGQNRALQLKGTQETLLKLAELGILDNEVAPKIIACLPLFARCRTPLAILGRPANANFARIGIATTFAGEKHGFCHLGGICRLLERTSRFG